MFPKIPKLTLADVARLFHATHTEGAMEHFIEGLLRMQTRLDLEAYEVERFGKKAVASTNTYKYKNGGDGTPSRAEWKKVMHAELRPRRSLLSVGRLLCAFGETIEKSVSLETETYEEFRKRWERKNKKEYI